MTEKNFTESRPDKIDHCDVGKPKFDKPYPGMIWKNGVAYANKSILGLIAFTCEKNNSFEDTAISKVFLHSHGEQLYIHMF